jgi:hypothetical protein
LLDQAREASADIPLVRKAGDRDRRPADLGVKGARLVEHVHAGMRREAQVRKT